MFQPARTAERGFASGCLRPTCVLYLPATFAYDLNLMPLAGA